MNCYMVTFVIDYFLPSYS